ncbi:MAG: glycosyltransferase family 2 protein [Candidatus Omnitrophica bacterium]|nr:glycosyltransferase family 2 protein [Candidatus Omnitrophota bacterium]MDD4012786.1 glycosyltransferase family 2 protein [Candidatus Omnitrophota bacterium]
MDLSIIIPAYNEEKRLAGTLDRITKFMETRGSEYEVIVVDDGSTDTTIDVAARSALGVSGRLRVISNPGNKGKGYSVKRGVEEARGDIILFTDADMSTPIEEMDKLISAMGAGAHIAIGSRAVDGSQVEVKQPFFRQTMGKVFNRIVRFILGENIHDTQCGFKAFGKTEAKELFRDMFIPGFAFDAELLYLARKRGLKVSEIGVVWQNSPVSKVRPVMSSLEMLRDVIKIRVFHR